MNKFNPIPTKPYSTNLEECLVVFEKIRYKSMGFPMVFLDYNYHFKSWSVCFRNPSTFSNPNIQEKTPLEAVHKMFDFLNEQKHKEDNHE